MDENKLTRSTWMSNIPNSMRIDMDLLDEVTGGTEGGSGYGMENAPLFRKFSDFWNGKEKKGVTGAGSRKEFLDNFAKWVKDGTPKNIAEWYEKSAS